jgi:hypothetical protein
LELAAREADVANRGVLEALELLEQRREDARAAEDGALIARNAADLFEDGYSHASGAADGAKASGPRRVLPHKAQQARAG